MGYSPLPQQEEILGCIRGKASIEPYFRHFKGTSKGESYDWERPPKKMFKNNVSFKPFVKFVEETFKARIQSGAISLLMKVGVVSLPHLILPLTVEPTKPRHQKHHNYHDDSKSRILMLHSLWLKMMFETSKHVLKIQKCGCIF